MSTSGRWDEEDWTMELAAAGATEVSMWDLNCGMEEEQRKRTQAALEARREELNASAGTRVKAEAAEELKKRNQAALAALRKKREESLPEGWKMVESNSKKGQVVYENIHTEERQAWFPSGPAPQPVAESQVGLSLATKEKNRQALAARKAKQGGVLPEGWQKVPSQSRPGEFVYENSHTGERIAWHPFEAAKTTAMPEQTLPQAKAAEVGRAMYTYTAESAEEMDLEVDDEVVIEHKADNGWWVGTNKRTGRLGMFPGSFVQML